MCAQVLLAHASIDSNIAGRHLGTLSTTRGKEKTNLLPTKARVSISIEALVALTEIRANDVSTASVGVTPVTT